VNPHFTFAPLGHRGGNRLRKLACDGEGLIFEREPFLEASPDAIENPALDVK